MAPFSTGNQEDIKDYQMLLLFLSPINPVYCFAGAEIGTGSFVQFPGKLRQHE